MATQNIQGYNITLSTSQIQEAIKQSNNNNSQGPDKLNIRHLKHIGPLGLAFLTSMFKTALNKNIIPHTWMLANIVPIQNPTKTQTRAPHTGPHPSSQYKNHTSRQRQFKTGVPQGDVLSPTPFNIYTSDLPPPSAPVQVMAYADDIAITSTHTSTSAAEKCIQQYLHKVFVWKKQNNLILNPDKTTCIQFTPDPAEYTSKGSGYYLRPKTHI